jgi:fructose-1,6-bisphosphatase I
MQQGLSVTEYLLKEAGAPTELMLLVSHIARACKAISHEVSRGALAGNLGKIGVENIQGETQEKLDVISDELVMDELFNSHQVAAIVSEEKDDLVVVPAKQRGRYLVSVDPLDGSSNISVNISVGTIFSVLPWNGSGDDEPTVQDFMQPGTNQICAGFCIYGPSTILILTTGNGTHGFTLDKQIGDFFLTHPDIRVEEDAKEFAINMSNIRFWDAPVKRYVDECLQGKDGPIGRDYNMRWIASSVAEAYRILMRGGLWTYPVDSKLKAKNLEGRLRLFYEAYPLAFIMEQAGAACTNGRERILDIQPTSIHQRVSLFFGAKNDAERIARYYKEMA